ncbi:MAG TPA: acyl-CoA dehydrogenase family protein, partial [Kofleriaceae bacterium]|nr:acyl-CoA dehydrogenase family protein [Kofleriaceae bacterium]
MAFALQRDAVEATMETQRAHPVRMELEESPIFRAVWGDSVPRELFTADPVEMSTVVRERLDRSIGVVRRRRASGTLYDAREIISDETMRELATAGYWGLRFEPRFGGAGASFAMLAQAITQMMLADPWVAGLASMQAALGPGSWLIDFGSPRQQERLLPPLARGERLGAFALTEPRASSDWSRMTTTARRDGDRLLITGEKLFITNAAPGRTISLLCWLDGRLELLVFELPWHESERFEVVDYHLRAPRHAANAGLRFRELPVPADSVLVSPSGDGRALAFRALNHGRVAVSATAAGMLRRIAGSVVPWVQQRETFGAPIEVRELVRRRLGRLAARIVAGDALVAWAAGLLDNGYRGELECITAKVFTTEALTQAAVQILLKTHGGRAFLDGNLFADHVHDLLAPAIYEGENELITLGFFNRLAQTHAAQYLVPIRDATRAAGFDRVDLRSPKQLWAARRPLASYVAWLAERKVHQLGPLAVHADLDRLGELANHLLRDAAAEISRLARHPEAAERQAMAHEIATRVQRATAMLVVTRHAARANDPIVQLAGACMGMELGYELLGERPSARYYASLVELGEHVARERFAPTANVERSPVAMLERLPTTER